MWNKAKIHHLLLSVVFIFVSSCFKDEAPQVQELDVGNFEGGCKIDTEKLKNLLEEHVYGEIDCIEKNFEQFSKLVSREDKNHIDKSDLTKFVNHFFKEQSKDIAQALDLLFDINLLALRGDRTKIHVDQLSSLFRILKTLNKHGVPLNALFKQLDQGRNYWEIRSSVESVIIKLSSDLQSELPSKGEDKKLGIISFLEQMKKNLGLSDEQLDLELVESMLFAKKIILGGLSGELAASELLDAVKKLPSVMMAAFDFMYLQDNPLDSTMEKDRIMLLSFKALTSSLHKFEADEVILTHKDLMTVGDKFLTKKDDPTTPEDEAFDFKDLEGTLINLKHYLIEDCKFGDPACTSDYSYGNIQKVLTWAKIVLERFYYFDLVYDHHKEQLDNKKPLSVLPRPELKEFEVFDRSAVFKHWEHFSYILKTFRTYHDENLIQYYTNDHYRSPIGFKIKSILLFALDLVVNKYGHTVHDPATGVPMFSAVTLDQLRVFLLHMEDAFRAMGMWPKYFERFLSEAQNSSDLFQFNSNGDGVISVVEATEYVSNILHAQTLAFDLKDALSEHYCDIVPDEDGGDAFLVPCYREYLFNALFDKLKYRKYFQKLYDYTVHFSKDEIRKYIVDVESFAKEEPQSDIPMSIVDLGRLMVSFSNIEGTFLRYDKDHSNILSREELDPGFEVFKKVLIDFGNLKPDQTKIALSIYLFILKNMESPEESKTKFIFFHLFGKKKNITARRMNVGAILALIAKATIPTNP